jgi:hypothetical protein
MKIEFITFVVSLAVFTGTVVAAEEPCDTIQGDKPPWASAELRNIGGKPISSYPSSALGYEVGEVMRLGEFTITPNPGSGEDRKLKIRPYSTNQFYNPRLGGLLVSFAGDEAGPPFTTLVRTDYKCAVVDSSIPPEDYSRYSTVIELKAATGERSSFLGVEYPVYRVNVSGADTIAGRRRFLLLITLPSGSAADVPIGLLPGTRIVVPSGLTVLMRAGSKEYNITSGAIDIRFDKRIRVEGTVKAK